MAEENFESEVGIHLIHDGVVRKISSSIDLEEISNELYKLDWDSDFYQFLVVKEPGVLMEVGGSLDPSDGLSAIYFNRLDGSEAVIKRAPQSVLEMKQILEAFLQPGDIWREHYEFDF